ncbi:glycoside hydrolase family 172 protein [Kribbella sp. NPDC051587]|uniref:glycoside hydrolase family 172 protein n=1 Tax=Kribbella sp. NPDC051587 TaxID=3364119 RepID=UPI0037B88938
MGDFNGLDVHLGNVARLSPARTFSISAENRDGAKGGGARATEGTMSRQARDLGVGWKMSPCIPLPAGSTTTLAEIEGSGAITHIWMTVDKKVWRSLVLRAYWDGEETPSIEVPLGDFFCSGWGEHAQISSVPVAVNPSGGFNSYWQMPFRAGARITIENLQEVDVPELFYQVDFVRTEVPDDAAYFHAQFRRSNPVPYGEVHTLLDGVQGQGQYVGTYLAWGCNNTGWWGEGEVKFYLDGDDEFPTICTTGTEDYFGGAWGFIHPEGVYATFTTPYLGMPQAIQPDGFMKNQQRFGLYRWHITDTIRFTSDLRVTVQALGWRRDGRFLQLQDDLASTSFWYQTEPHAPFPSLPSRDYLEVI